MSDWNIKHLAWSITLIKILKGLLIVFVFFSVD